VQGVKKDEFHIEAFRKAQKALKIYYVPIIPETDK
jgi:hypothetical protein